jgi:hypothetical protein
VIYKLLKLLKKYNFGDKKYRLGDMGAKELEFAIGGQGRRAF